MELDTETRGLLEKIIDTVVKRRAEKGPTYKNENDFVLGHALGTIQQTFLVEFFATLARVPNELKKSEINKVISRRPARGLLRIPMAKVAHFYRRTSA